MSSPHCARTKETIPSYLEHESEPAEALQVARHLSDCSECAGEAERVRSVISMLRALPAPAPQPGTAEGVLSRLRRMKIASSPHTALKWSALSALVALLLVKVSLPAPVWQSGLRVLAQIGDLVDFDFLLGRIAEGIARILPTPSSFFDGQGFGYFLNSTRSANSPHNLELTLLTIGLMTFTVMGAAFAAGLFLAAKPVASVGRRLLRRF